jgi:Zn ribbon nucleic-acid-binding protein
MNCPKCKGLLVREMLYTDASIKVPEVHCVNCGWMQLGSKEEIEHANKTKDRRINKLDELELYRIGSRST